MRSSTVTKRQGWLIRGILALAALTAVNIAPVPVRAGVEMVLLVTGVAAITGWAVAPGGRGIASPLHDVRKQVMRALPLIAVMALALVLRLWNLDGVIHLFVDETNFSDGVVRLRDNPASVDLLTPFGAITTFTWVYPYLQAVTSSIFGPSLLAMRLPSVLFGTLTIPAVYWLVWELCTAGGRGSLLSPAPLQHDDGSRAGGRGSLHVPAPLRQTTPIPLAAALVLATYPPHVHFSRLGLNNIADPLFGTLALALTLRGLRTGSARAFALAGVMLGSTAYFYEGGRLLFPVVVGLALLIQPRRTWANRRGIAQLALLAVVTMAPLYITWAAQDRSFTPRLDVRGPASERRYWLGDEPSIESYLRRHLWVAAGHVLFAEEGIPSFYAGHTALVLMPLVPLLLLGMWKTRREPLLSGWVVLGVLGNSLLAFSDWSPRFVVIFPALAALVAVGGVGLADAVWRVVGGRGYLRSPTPLRIALVSVIAVGQVMYYFGPHVDAYNLQVRRVPDTQDVMFRQPEGVPSVLVTEQDVFFPQMAAMSRYLRVDTPDVIHPDDFDIDAIDARPVAVFFDLYNDLATLDALVASGATLDEPGFSPYASVPPNRQYAQVIVR